MDRLGRLDTEALIQDCRDGYDASKNKEIIRELELVLELRNKEMHLLASQLSECKQEASVKILNLEQSLSKLQRENADLRIAVIKAKRLESEKAQQQIKNVRNQCQMLLQEQQQKHLKVYQALQEKFNQHIKRNEEKTSQLSQINKDQNATLKILKEQKYNTIEVYAKSLQAQKSQLQLGKRDAQKRLESLRQAYQNMKNQYQISLKNKEDVITQLKGESQGLKFKERLLNERLQQEKHNFAQLRINSKYDQDQLTAINEKLQKEKQQLTDLLESKNQEIMQFIQLGARSIGNKITIPPSQSCEHIGLIKQFQKSLELKETELKQLRSIVQEWGDQIGFNQPYSSRYGQLLATATKTEKMKFNQYKILKEKNQSLNSNQKLK